MGNGINLGDTIIEAHRTNITTMIASQRMNVMNYPFKDFLIIQSSATILTGTLESNLVAILQLSIFR